MNKENCALKLVDEITLVRNPKRTRIITRNFRLRYVKLIITNQALHTNLFSDSPLVTCGRTGIGRGILANFPQNNDVKQSGLLTYLLHGAESFLRS